MTISQEHRDRLRALHERDPQFGVIGHLWVWRVVAFMMELRCRSHLDYGAGRSGLAVFTHDALQKLGVEADCRQYEPAFGDRDPQPADFVTCIDVMEHVERDQIDAVLADLARLQRTAGLITISLRAGTKKNRDTHPNVKPREWWLAKVSEHFAHTQEVPILDPAKAKSEVAMFVRPK